MLPESVQIHRADIERRLRYLRYVAGCDALLLFALLACSWLELRQGVRWLGPLHGANFLLLLLLACTGALDRCWSWRYRRRRKTSAFRPEI